MCLREHVFNFLTRPYVPIRNVMLQHCCLVFRLQALSLTDVLHNFEGHRVIKSLLNKIKHNAVTSSNNLRNRTRARFYQLLCVSKPNVGSVCQTRYLQKVRKGFRLCIDKNLLDKSRSHFGDSVGSKQASAYLLRCYSKRLCGGKKLVYRFIVHFDVKNACVCIPLKHLILCRNIVSELVKLQYSVVKIRELEMRRDYIRIWVVSGMLNRCEIVYFIFRRNNYDSAGVLSRCALDSDKLSYHMGYFRLRNFNLSLFKILAYITPRRLIGKSAYRSRSENVALTEKLFRVFMNLTLHITREVKVDIGGFITVESKEGFKRYIVTVLIHKLTANGASLVLKVKSRANSSVSYKFAVLTL